MRVNPNNSVQNSDQVTVECITDYTEFQALQSAWDELHEDSIFPSIYNTFLLIDESIKAYGDNQTHLRIYVLSNAENDELIAIFPFEIHLEKWLKLTFNDYGFVCLNDNLDKPYPVIRQGHHDAAWRTLLHSLKDNPTEWHHFFLRDIPTFLPTLERLPTFCQDIGLRYEATFDSTGPKISLNGDWDSFFRKHRSLKRKIKRMDKDFGDRVRFEIIDDKWEWCLEQYNALEKKTWKHESGIDSDTETRSFYRSLLENLAAENRVIFGFIYIDDNIIAADMVYFHKDTAYFPHACFDPDYHKYSPSMIATAWMLRHLYETPYQIGDYLCGYADYMNSWCDEIIETYDISIYRPSLLVSLKLGGRQVKKLLRSIKQRLLAKPAASS